jgi:hypothetical protein
VGDLPGSTSIPQTAKAVKSLRIASMSPICMAAKLTQPESLGSQTDAASWLPPAVRPVDMASRPARSRPRWSPVRVGSRATSWGAERRLADDPVPSWPDRWGRTVWSAGRKLRSAARNGDGATTGRQARLVADWIYFNHPRARTSPRR